ncbi:hypothetical protein [Dictyobacter formicarum]|uniref:Nucleotidyltransferase domain-containing protein n=1 Tax=Dictyobacter formicarum TaxID=2778368 RepID=A0ABQ3VK04_9CHLR|nr:hypothetical protein [Dictyobacter formicarum]GHO86425.1 hypothetical protein KSZ_44310 [Dictyobacter formicarum]
MQTLSLEMLPALPQRATIVQVASTLWERDDVLALWVGGSLASGNGDVMSDVDFRVAVSPQQLDAWRQPVFEHLFTQTAVVGHSFISFGDNAFLHHLVFSNGEIFDFFVQSTEKLPTAEPLMVLGCRSEPFQRMLDEQNRLIVKEALPVVAATVEQLVVDFWISTHKHRKVLFRDLYLLVPLGLSSEANIIMRLWYIQSKSEDCGDLRQQTIHSFSQVARTLGRSPGPDALTMLGAPIRNLPELCSTIELHRTIVANVGRELARKYGFTYPANLEAMVIENWQRFKSSLPL